MSEKDGGAAFPMLDHNGHSLVCREPGMTLRDWFAGQALAGWMASFTPDCGVKAKHCAELAYELADAMLAARTEGAADNG